MARVKKYQFIYIVFIISLLTSCASFRNSTLFESDKSRNESVFESTLLSMNKSYVIQKTDVLAISAFPNKGEQLIDPTMDFPIGGSDLNRNGNISSNRSLISPDVNQANFPISSNGEPPRTYTVDSNGEINVARIGYVKLEGLTLLQADSLLAIKFSEYMKSPYVITQYLNKKVILMGALGDRLIPINKENTSLYEIIAQGGQALGVVQGGVQSNLKDARVDKIKIIRNYNTNNMSVLNVDLSTIEGAMKLQTNIQPDDIVYIEPRRNFDGSTFSDISRIVSPIGSVIALVITIIALNR